MSFLIFRLEPGETDSKFYKCEKDLQTCNQTLATMTKKLYVMRTFHHLLICALGRRYIPCPCHKKKKQPTIKPELNKLVVL